MILFKHLFWTSGNMFFLRLLVENNTLEPVSKSVWCSPMLMPMLTTRDDYQDSDSQCPKRNRRETVGRRAPKGFLEPFSYLFYESLSRNNIAPA